MGTILKIENISKAFPGVQALDSVSFDVEEGEVHAVIGENGAGKSTLMKILAGSLSPDEGTLWVNGAERKVYSPQVAQDEGIAMIAQEFNLIPYLTAAQNIALGREPKHLGLISPRLERELAKSALDALGTHIPLDKPVRRLSIAQQQLVEIAKALSQQARILIMDEPTSALSMAEREKLFALISKLRKRKVTILYVTHHLEEVFRVADRVTVLKDGRRVATLPITEASPGRLITLMVGRQLTQVFPPKAKQLGEPVLVVQNLSSGSQVRDVSFSLRAGEILGLYGLMGSGRTELCQALFGARPHTGKVIISGRSVKLRHPKAAIKQGLALIPEDRKSSGLILKLSLRHNLALPSLSRRQFLGVVQTARETQAVNETITRLDIRTASVETEVITLSGGNQQKVVIGKWLLSEPRVLICDEPTRGVDVSAKVEIYNHLRNLASQGFGILFVSSDLPEILGMSDRILVMRKGTIVAEFDAVEASEEKILAAALLSPSQAEEHQAESGSPPASPGRRGAWFRRIWKLSADHIVYIFLIALFLAGVCTSKRFLSPYNLTSILRHAVPLGLVAMGQAFVMVSGGVDLSVGSVITLTTLVTASVLNGRDAMIPLAIVASLGMGLLIGVLNGIAVVGLRITPFIATLGMMSVLRGIVLVVTRGPLGSIGPYFRTFSRGTIGPLPSALIILLVAFFLAALVMNRTRYGRHLLAIGGQREVARLAGIRVHKLEFSSYLVSAFTAVVAGLYLTSRMGAGGPTVGPGFELDSIIAVLVGGIPFGGGRGRLSGVIAGVLLLTVLGNVLTIWNLQSWYHQIARATILLAAISLIRKEV